MQPLDWARPPVQSTAGNAAKVNGYCSRPTSLLCCLVESLYGTGQPLPSAASCRDYVVFVTGAKQSPSESTPSIRETRLPAYQDSIFGFLMLSFGAAVQDRDALMERSGGDGRFVFKTSKKRKGLLASA